MFIPSKRIREAVISQALSPRGQACLRACNGRTVAAAACGAPELASDEGR